MSASAGPESPSCPGDCNRCQDASCLGSACLGSEQAETHQNLSERRTDSVPKKRHVEHLTEERRRPRSFPPRTGSPKFGASPTVSSRSMSSGVVLPLTSTILAQAFQCCTMLYTVLGQKEGRLNCPNDACSLTWRIRACLEPASPLPLDSRHELLHVLSQHHWHPRTLPPEACSTPLSPALLFGALSAPCSPPLLLLCFLLLGHKSGPEHAAS